MKDPISPVLRTVYYSWFGDACRMHVHANGKRTADLYRGLRGIIPINPIDLLRGALEISEVEYQRLFEREMALHEKKNTRDFNRRLAKRLPLAISHPNFGTTSYSADSNKGDLRREQDVRNQEMREPGL